MARKKADDDCVDRKPRRDPDRLKSTYYGEDAVKRVVRREPQREQEPPTKKKKGSEDA